MIKGKLIELVPATLDERRKVYEWCFHSETSKSHSGPPDYPDIEIPAFEEFCYEDYVDFFFTGERAEAGRGFMILREGEAIGFLSYTSYHLKAHFTEFDIWIGSEANCGKGFGTEALRLLADYMGETMGIREIIMRPSNKNMRAVNSYKKAGFVESGKSPDYYMPVEYISQFGEGDYGEGKTALLIKRV